MYCVAKVFYRAFSLQPLKGAFRTVLRLFLSPPASCFERNRFTADGRPGLRERPPGESQESNAMHHRLPIKMVRNSSSSDAPRKLRERCEEVFLLLRGTRPARKLVPQQGYQNLFKRHPAEESYAHHLQKTKDLNPDYYRVTLAKPFRASTKNIHNGRGGGAEERESRAIALDSPLYFFLSFPKYFPTCRHTT